MSSIIASLFSSFVPTIHADAPSDQGQPPSDQGQSPSDQIQPAEEQLPSDQKRPTEEEEEEEEEDPHPDIREECKTSAKCAALTKHFEHCQERVRAGHGFKGEDCVEELFMYVFYPGVAVLVTDLVYWNWISVHMMHCVDRDAAPKLFAKLR